ncbi:MAG: substrate-binding domain-containing protein [Oscillospiraceae bacterium]|nr:substrate-binding domain-containing protein [Oscillospiraceae bacterium]
MKKVLALVLSLALLCTVLVGCGSSSGGAESSAPSAEASPSNAPSASSYTYKQVGETTNAKMVEQDPSSPLKFAFIGFANNSYWDLIYEGVNAAKDFLSQHNVTVDVINLGSDINADVINDALDSCESQGYNGIVMTCFVSGCENYINACVDSGCPVAIIGGDAGECGRFCFIGQNNEEAGLTVAKAIDKALGGKAGATFACITSQFSMTNIETKRNACIDYLESKGYVCVGSYEAHDSADETYSITEQLLTANTDLGAIYCCAGGTYGAPKAVEDNDRVDSVYVIGHDETEENLEYVRKGELDVIGQNPTGYAFDAFIYLYNKAVANQDPEQEVMSSLSQIIDKSNVDELFPAK